mmetsp:Transcript_6176/g.21941  ORF Transcript_6176/g.21941 Transcript_6176/m.21941 type:complete len:257 (+) Transcript_6176:2852-3622(+)
MDPGRPPRMWSGTPIAASSFPLTNSFTCTLSQEMATATHLRSGTAPSRVVDCSISPDRPADRRSATPSVPARLTSCSPGHRHPLALLPLSRTHWSVVLPPLLPRRPRSPRRERSANAAKFRRCNCNCTRISLISSSDRPSPWASSSSCIALIMRSRISAPIGLLSWLSSSSNASSSPAAASSCSSGSMRRASAIDGMRPPECSRTRSDKLPMPSDTSGAATVVPSAAAPPVPLVAPASSAPSPSASVGSSPGAAAK